MNEAFEEIKRYRRYLKYPPMSSYLEIAFLPLGEALGYDNHPAKKSIKRFLYQDIKE